MAETLPPFKSSVPELTPPAHGFVSNIPSHLLAETDPATKWIMEELSKNTQMGEFTLHAALQHNEYLRQLNGRVAKTEGLVGLLNKDVDELKDEAESMSSLRKIWLAFGRLWEYRAFQLMVYGFMFFFFSYLLPWYLRNPFDLNHLFNLVFGGK